MIQPERVHYLNEEYPTRGRYVLYWMQQSQRARCNHALEFAVREADRLRVPVLCVFGITQRFPEAHQRHYAFMLEGLAQTDEALRRRGIKLTVRLDPPVDAVLSLADSACIVVADRGYLRIQRSWRERLAKKLPCRFIQVESDVVVPVETVSGKEEYAARTLRPRIERRLERFMMPLAETGPDRDSLDLRVSGLDVSDPTRVLRKLRVGRARARIDAPAGRDTGATDAAAGAEAMSARSRAGGTGSSSGAGRLKGGPEEAGRLLERFLSEKLNSYPAEHSDPGLDCQSELGPYLHFGQISPLDVALQVRSKRGVHTESKDVFLEELIVRRELAMNFCLYNQDYDSYDCLPSWARQTLGKHARDRREYVYDEGSLERAETHDPYWNAAQNEMRATGKMHGYMRMYWGKKIIEWTRTPEEAFQTALALNNRYSLDGRDPNSFAGVAWCFGKHDQAWKERAIFGKVRWMSAAGLDRKFSMDDYVARIDRVVSARRP